MLDAAETDAFLLLDDVAFSACVGQPVCEAAHAIGHG